MRFHLVSFLLGVALVVLAILFVGILGQVRADAVRTWVIGPAFSHHTRREGQREIHPGIGIERNYSDAWRLILDIRQNSSNDLSLYAVYCYTPWQALSWRLGGCAGGATGYATRDKAQAERRERSTWEALKPAPFGALAASIERRDWGLNVGLIPIRDPVFFIQWKFPTDR